MAKKNSSSSSAGYDLYDDDILGRDSLTSRILASKDPQVAALMKQQSAG